MDQTPEKSFGYGNKDDHSRRSHNYAASQRNKSPSPDVALTKNGIFSYAQYSEKFILYLWGFTAGLGLDSNWEKIGEHEEELKDLSFSDGHVVLLTDSNKVLVRGKNDYIQLGFDARETLNSFKMLSVGSKII